MRENTVVLPDTLQRWSSSSSRIGGNLGEIVQLK